MGRELWIDGTRIADDTRCWVIAEIGHNHQGSLEKAKELFRQAKAAGASAAKLQKRDNRTLFTRALFEKPYENEDSFGATYGRHREALEFGREQYHELSAYAREIGITFFATAFDMPSVDFLAELEVPAFKVASGDIRNTPLLRRIAKVGRPMIVSTGAATLDDVRRAYDTIMPLNGQLSILQCTAGYPAEFAELNLRVIETYRREFPTVAIGLSAHDSGIAMAVAAYVIGARIVEKHFTLNRAMKGTDHKFSLEPVGLRKLVRDLDRVHVALGTGEKKIYKSEEPALGKMGKSLVASRALEKGTVLTEELVAIKSPGGGLPPYELERVVGKAVRRPLNEDEVLRVEDLGL